MPTRPEPALPPPSHRVGGDPWAIERSAVVEAAAGPGAGPVVVVSAPAGYGKSTVLGQLAARSGRRTVWISPAEDDGPRAFWDAVVERCRQADPAQLGDLRADDGSGVRRGLLAPLVERLGRSSTSWFVVLDDVHRLVREDTRASVDWFLRHLPAGLAVGVGSRGVADLPALERLRAHGSAVDVTALELAFSAGEIETVLERRYGLRLTAAEVASVDERTGGWPAAVSLVGAAMRRGMPLESVASVGPGTSPALEALVREGLAGTSPQAARVLSELSVLEQFDESVVRDVVSTDAWAIVMRDPVRTGLVRPLDEHGRWWRMHHLVREVLHQRLGREDPDLRRALHARAAAAYERLNDVTSTIRHLLGAEDYHAVADVLSDVRRNFAVRSQVVGLAWLERIPEPVRAVDARLSFWEAWAMATSGDRVRRDRALLHGRAASRGEVGDFADWGAVEDFVRSSACFDDVAGSLGAADRFLARAAAGGALDTLVRASRGFLLYLAGRAREAVTELRTLRGELVEVPRPLALLLPTYEALALLELGDRAGAAVCVEEAARARLVHAIGPDAVYLVAAQPVARLRTESGEPRAGLQVARDALAQVLATGDGMLVAPYLLGEVARALVALGRPGDAAVAAAQARQLVVGAVDAGALPERLTAIVGDDVGTRLGDPVSARELEVLLLLPSRLTAPEIAARLFVSPNTARTHVKSIYRKLGARSRADAVRRARDVGLLGE